MPRLEGADLSGIGAHDVPVLVPGAYGDLALPLAIGEFRDRVVVSGPWPSGVGALAISVFADLERTRGTEVVLAADGSVEIWRCTESDPRLLRRWSTTVGPGTHFLVSASTGRLVVRRDGEIVGAPTPLSGPPTGRVLLGARAATVDVSALSVEGLLEPDSVARWRRRALLPELPPRVGGSRPLRSTLSTEPPEAIGEGLSPIDRDVLAGAWRSVASGAHGAAVERLDGLVRRHPDCADVRLLLGACAGMGSADPVAAVHHLSAAGRARDGCVPLLADAYWSLGRGEAVRALLPELREPHDRNGFDALLAFSEGASPQSAPGRDARCRRCAQRSEFAADLRALESWPPLRWDRGAKVRVGIDGVAADARRIRTESEAFLIGLNSWLPPPRRQRPVAIVVLDSTVAYDAWNERLGGVDHSDTDGVYRAGPGLMLVLDDPDPAVVRRRVTHELVHHRVQECDLDLPLGFEEGLASALAAVKSPLTTPSGRALADDPIRRRMSRVALGRGVGVVEALAARDLGGGETGAVAYSVSWAAVSGMIARDRRGFVAFLDQLGGPDQPFEQRRSNALARLTEAWRDARPTVLGLLEIQIDGK